MSEFSGSIGVEQERWIFIGLKLLLTRNFLALERICSSNHDIWNESIASRYRLPASKCTTFKLLSHL
jgi:hypothetical protein